MTYGPEVQIPIPCHPEGCELEIRMVFNCTLKLFALLSRRTVNSEFCNVYGQHNAQSFLCYSACSWTLFWQHLLQKVRYLLKQTLVTIKGLAGDGEKLTISPLFICRFHLSVYQVTFNELYGRTPTKWVATMSMCWDGPFHLLLSCIHWSGTTHQDHISADVHGHEHQLNFFLPWWYLGSHDSVIGILLPIMTFIV